MFCLNNLETQKISWVNMPPNRLLECYSFGARSGSRSVFILDPRLILERLAFVCSVYQSVSNWIVYSKQILNRGSKESSLVSVVWGYSQENATIWKGRGCSQGFFLGDLIAQGLEGYSRVPRFDQNTVRDSEKVNGIRDFTATWGAGFEKIWAWISDELEKKTIFGIADDQRSGNSVDSREKKKSWNSGSDSPFHTLIGDLILLLMFWTREGPPPLPPAN